MLNRRLERYFIIVVKSASHRMAINRSAWSACLVVMPSFCHVSSAMYCLCWSFAHLFGVLLYNHFCPLLPCNWFVAASRVNVADKALLDVVGSDARRDLLTLRLLIYAAALGWIIFSKRECSENGKQKTLSLKCDKCF